VQAKGQDCSPLAEAKQVDHLVRFRLQREPCYAPQSCCLASEGRRATASRARPTNSGPPYKFRTALQILDRPTNSGPPYKFRTALQILDRPTNSGPPYELRSYAC
jgi:hypothetical protein